jgi:CheY-like chemotaxis protein
MESRAEALNQASSVVAFTVADTGVGVQPEDQQRIFEAFAQGDGTTARGYSGTGLGLSISRELIGLLGGEITLASTLGEGATFTVYLPERLVPTEPAPEPAASVRRPSRAPSLAVPAAPAAPTHRPSSAPSLSALAGTRFLIVDDDARNSFALSALLEQGYADVTVADGGVQALATLDAGAEFDIVLMDIMMPVMDGYATMQAIRAIERYESLAIVVVTGKVVADERQRCLDAGADDYVPKPVDTAELLAAVGPWLPAARREAAAAGAEVSTITTSPSDLPATLDAPAGRRAGSGRAPAPRTPGQPGDGPGSGEPGQDHAIEGRRILVVDDDYRNSFALSALLERGRATVVVADSGAAAIATLETAADIDIVLMDIMMPDMDGYEAMRAIREIGSCDDLPIIAVTSKVLPGERQRCIDAGANDYVTKPVDAADLLAALSLWLPTKESELAAGAHSVPDRVGPRETLMSAIAGIKILMVDDDPRNIYALSAMLESGKAEVTVADSGPEALAAHPAITRLRHRADGHHDAGHGRLRDHSRDPRDRPPRIPADHRGHRQGGLRRAPALRRCGRERLRAQAGRHRGAARRAQALAPRDPAGLRAAPDGAVGGPGPRRR